MTIYKYHQVTKELIGKRVPIKPEIPGENETDVVPPLCTGTQTPIFVDGNWTIVADYRRIIFYNKSTHQQIRLALGQKPDDSLTRLKPADHTQVWSEETQKWVYPLSVLKIKKQEELYRLCDKKLNEVLKLYPKTEPDTWAEKTRQSETWLRLSAPEKSGVFLDQIARLFFAMLFTEAVGKIVPEDSDIPDIDSLATRIMQNKTGFGAYAGLILKLKTDVDRLILAANTIDELNSIPIDFSGIKLKDIRDSIIG